MTEPDGWLWHRAAQGVAVRVLAGARRPTPPMAYSPELLAGFCQEASEVCHLGTSIGLLEYPMILTPTWVLSPCKQFSKARWVSHSSVQFWHYLHADCVGSHRLGAQSHKTAPFHTPVRSPGGHLCFWLTSCKSEVSAPPSLGSMNLLEQLTDLRKLFAHKITGL